MPPNSTAPRDSGFTTSTPVPAVLVRLRPAPARAGCSCSTAVPAPTIGICCRRCSRSPKTTSWSSTTSAAAASRAPTIPSPITWQTHVEDLAAVASELGLDPLGDRRLLVGRAAGDALLDQRSTARFPVPVPGFPILPSSRFPIPDSLRSHRSGSDHSQTPRAVRGGVFATPAGPGHPGPARRAGRLRSPRARPGRVSPARASSSASPATSPTPRAHTTSRRFASSVASSRASGAVSVTSISRPSLADVAIPALIVHGREDPIPLESSEVAARALGARLVVLDDCGHVPYVEQPQSLFDAVRDFLTQTTPVPRGDAP